MALHFNRKTPLFEKRSHGQSRRVGGSQILLNWKLFWTHFIQIKIFFCFKKETFNKASNIQMLYPSKIGPGIQSVDCEQMG